MSQQALMGVDPLGHHQHLPLEGLFRAWLGIILGLRPPGWTTAPRGPGQPPGGCQSLAKPRTLKPPIVLIRHFKDAIALMPLPNPENNSGATAQTNPSEC